MARATRRAVYLAALVSAAAWQAVAGACENWCSQHGICTDPGPEGYCDCEVGYAGDGCERALCPKGDDPLTTGQAPRTIVVTVSAAKGVLEGTVDIHFQRETTTFDAHGAMMTSRECTARVERLRNVRQALCERTALDEATGAAEYVIKFLRWPVRPWENNLYAHDGNPPLSSFSCDTGGIGAEGVHGAECRVADGNAAEADIAEYAECSNRGRCDARTGACSCDRGFKGAACDDNEDLDDALLAEAGGPYFSGTVLKVRAQREPSDAFRALDVVAGPQGRSLFTVSGRGDVAIKGGALDVAAPGGDGRRSTLRPGHLRLSNGSLEMEDASLRVASAGAVLRAGAADGALAIDAADGRPLLRVSEDATRLGGDLRASGGAACAGGLSAGGGVDVPAGT